MQEKIEQEQIKEPPNIQVGDTIRVHQKIKEGEKERVQIFEGLVIAQKHGKGISGTVIVRKIIDGIGTEKIFPLHSPNVEKFEIISRGKVRRSKLYYLRDRLGKKAKIQKRDYIEEKDPESNQKKTAKEPSLEKKEAPK